jgi:hypothetical protein
MNTTSSRVIADATGIGRTKVNDLLNRLQLLGFIERSLDRTPHLRSKCAISDRTAFTGHQLKFREERYYYGPYTA